MATITDIHHTHNWEIDDVYYPILNSQKWWLIDEGHIYTRFEGKTRTLQSVVWFLAHGIWSDRLNPIDHINKNCFDTHLANLQQLSIAEHNKKHGRIGYKGGSKRLNKQDILKKRQEQRLRDHYYMFEYPLQDNYPVV